MMSLQKDQEAYPTFSLHLCISSLKKKEWREEKGRILSLGASGIHQETHMQKFRQAMFSPPIGVEGKVGPG